MDKIEPLQHNIKFLREYLNMTQKKLGDDVGASEDKIGTYEKRGTRPKTPIINRLVRVFGIPRKILESVELDEDLYNKYFDETLVDVQSEPASIVKDSGDDNPYKLSDKKSDKIIEDLAASSRDHAAADLKRAEAEILREQNHKRIIDHITGNETVEIPEAIESRFSDLLELIARLGTGTRWKNEKDAREELSRLWHGEKKVSSKAGIRDGSGK